VSYNKIKARWCAYRHRKDEKPGTVFNGSYYKDKEIAAHASDTLARKLMAIGEKGHKLNFPDDETEVYPEKVKFSSNYIGVSYNKNNERWQVQRWSKNEKNNVVYNGSYKDEETAAHASDTLARKLIANGEKGHKLNFPDDHTEVYPEEVKGSSNFIGVSYNKGQTKWCAYRQSKNGKKKVYNGSYKDEETAAHASDILARKLIANGEKGHRLNFPDDDTEVYSEESTYQRKKRKRPRNLGNYQERKSNQISKK